MEALYKTANKKVRRLQFNLVTGWREGSPVDTGFFRANWRARVGRVPFRAPAGQRVRGNIDDVTWQRDLGQALTKFDIKKKHKIFTTNSVPYAADLANGSSPQARRGWVLRTMIREVRKAESE